MPRAYMQDGILQTKQFKRMLQYFLEVDAQMCAAHGVDQSGGHHVEQIVSWRNMVYESLLKVAHQHNLNFNAKLLRHAMNGMGMQLSTFGYRTYDTADQREANLQSLLKQLLG